MIRLLLFAALLGTALLLATGGGETLRRWLRRHGRKALIALAAVAYLVSPLDLVPDVGPPGLLDDLLVLLAAWWWASARGGVGTKDDAAGRRQNAGAARSSPSGDGGRDPYEVLGVARGASRDEIARAYREQMKRYHPDRVADLGPELQELAHRKTIEIQRAWEALGGS